MSSASAMAPSGAASRSNSNINDKTKGEVCYFCVIPITDSVPLSNTSVALNIGL